MLPGMRKPSNPFGDIQNKDLADDPDHEIKADGDEPAGDEETPVPDENLPELPGPSAPPADEPADEPAASADELAVEMIHHETSLAGKNLIPGDVVTLPKAYAENLIATKRAKAVS